MALAVSAVSASATSIGYVTGSTGNAASNLTTVVNGGLLTPTSPDTLTAISAATFNGLSTAALLATYDTIVLPWTVTSGLNADWNTVLLPYLNGGGSILWEDPANLGDLAASGLGLSTGNFYPGIGPGQISLVAPFGDAGAEGYYHIHFSILSASSAWSVWSTDVNGGIHGVYREFANGGRMVLGVSDNLYHPSFSSPIDSDHYQLTVNQLNWLNTGSITGTVPDAGASALLVGLGLSLLAAFRRRFV